MKSLLLIAILWIACPRAWALDGDIELAQIAHRSWTLIERAPTEVTGFAQTPDGLLWISSATGLHWFDGFKFTYQVSSNAWPSYNLTALLAGSDGTLWVGFKSGAAGHIVASELTLFGEREGLSSGPVHAIVQDLRGTLWLASHGGLFRFDGSRWQPVDLGLGLHNSAVTGAFVARDGTLWFTARDGVYSLLANEQRLTHVVREQFTQNVTRYFAQAPDGAIWLSDPSRGLLSIEPEAAPGLHRWRLEGKRLGVLTFDREGSLWLGGDRLRRIVAARSDTVEELGPDSGLSGGTVTGIFQDRAGDMWVGTEGGIDRFRHANLVWATAPPIRSPKAIVAGNFNRVWAAYPDGSLLTFEGRKLVRRETAPVFTAGLRDRDGEIWFGGPEVIAHLRNARSVDEQRFDVTPLPARLRGSAVQTMVRDGSGGLWISIEGKGLFRWSDGEWDAENDARLPDEAPLVSTLDASGNVWFGYTNNRLARVSGNTVRLFTTQDGLKVGDVTALYSRGKRLWIGGGVGLALFDGAFTELFARNCQTFVAITGLAETASNDLWIFRRAAVSRVTQVDAALEAITDNYLECASFGTQERPSPSPQQVRPTPSLLEAEDGRVWLAANEGLAWLDPTRIREALAPPQRPGIDGIIVVGEQPGGAGIGDLFYRAMPHKTIALEANPGDLRLRFHAVELTAPEYLTFRYKLEGQDQGWKATGGTEVVYTNLAPGEYRFVVQAGNSRTGQFSEPAIVSFGIPPAFYQATWFRALCAFFAAMVLVFIYRWQVRRAGERLRVRLEDRMNERERIARELHDTLLQGIQALVLRFQGVASRIPAQEPARDMMERALELADDVIAEGRDRVNDLRDSSGTPVDLSEEIARVGKELLQDTGIRFGVAIDGEPRALHPIVREESLLIAREALANAHRHARPRAIEVSLAYERAGLRIGIRDDGRGIDPEVLRAGGRDRHWGLMGMRERATRIRGHLEIWSRGGAGTEVELRVPAAVAYRDQRTRWSWLSFRRQRGLDVLSR